MKKFVALLFIASMVQFSFGQTTFIAVANGNWNASGTWSTDGFTPIVCATCVAGTDYPGATDDAYTNGFAITIGGSISCRDLFVENVAGSLIFPGSLTVNGVMTGWTGGQFGFPTNLTVNVFTGNSIITFTAADLSNAGGFNFFNNEVLGSWNNNSPIIQGSFNLSNPGTIDAGFSGGAIRFSQMVMQNGNLSTGFNLNAIEVGNAVAMNANTTFNTSVPIYGFSGVSSKINQVLIQNGAALNLSTSTSYINANTFTLNGTSSLGVNFTGSNQTQGWWYQDNSPTITNISSTSMVEFSANADQNIPADDYGNLRLTGSGALSKTLQSIGTLKVNGDLSINSSTITFLTSGNLSPIDISGDIDNDGIWAPTQEVIFNGSTAQNIGGNNDTTFEGDVTISNISGTVQLLNHNIDVNGVLDIDVGATFSANSEQVNLAGDLVVDGTLTASGTFVFDGTTTISGSGTIAFDNITVSNTISSPSQTLLVAGDFVNNGTFSNTNGTTTFNGINAQFISGSQTIDLTNLSITNSNATVSNNGIIGISSLGTVTMGANTVLDVDGNGSGIFTLLSTSASASATVAEVPITANITGNIRWQRYFDGGGDVWRNFGVPLSNATISDIQNDGLTVSGAFTGTDAGAANFYYYDETSLGDVDQGWVAYPTTSNVATVSNLRGYSFWTRTEDNIPGVVELTGILNTGAINFGVTYTDDAEQAATEDGWNLVNNPYPASIEWGDTDWNKTNIATVAQVFDTSLGAYRALNGSGVIAPGQSFWVQTIGSSPSLIAQEGVKSTGGSFERQEGLSNHLLISLVQEDKIDKAHIQFKDVALDELDLLYDGVKLENNIYNLSSKATSGESLIVNSMGSLVECSKTVELNITNIDAGNYDLIFEDLSSFTQGYEIILHDNFLTKNTLLSEGMIYPFTVTEEIASWGDTRFEVEFSAVALETNLNTFTVNDCDQEFVSIYIDSSQAGVDYSLMSDDKIIVSGIGNGDQIELQILKSLLVKGSNMFELTLNNGVCDDEIADKSITFDFVTIAEVSAVENGSSCGTGSVIISADGAPTNGYYKWYESIDAVESIANENASNFTTPELGTSKTYFVSVINSQGCESSIRVPVDAIINELPDIPEIIAEGSILVSTSKINNQWYKDGVIIDGAINNTYEALESGSYSVSVENSSNCHSSSENIVMTITGIINDKLGNEEIKIFPNPISDEQYLTISLNGLPIYESIFLYNGQGKLMITQEIKSTNETQLNMSSFKKGIYFIHLVGNEGSTIYKILKD